MGAVAVNLGARWTLRDAVVAMIVVAIALILVVAGLPAARERARRSQCQENLRQIGLALQSYHQASGMLAPWGCLPSPALCSCAAPDGC
ncbi:MAG: DUF1559 domain-containing protein [Rhodopirellula sp.]|nr:DUF1559 domain-containing protein [Rhodopirellula sp.]